MTFALFYRDIEVGGVQQRDADFPNLSGVFTPKELPENASISEHLRDYMEISIALDKLMFEDESAYNDCVEERERPFIDLIESNDWFLVAEDGEKTPILVPNFVAENGIIWRYNLQEMEK